jgi:galactokinase
MVGVATALVRVGEIAASPAWQSNIGSTIDAAGYFGCVENGSRFGTLEGDAGVGTHGGSEDHAAILTSDASHLSAFSFVPMREIRRVRVADAWRFVIAPSGVVAEKTGGALGAYNRLSEGARVLLALWNANGTPSISLGAALASQPDAVDRLHDCIRRSGGAPGWTADALAQRLDHFVREDARIAAAADAFASVDRAGLAVLSDGSQADAEQLLGNQVPETIALARHARELGAFGACSFGAGFGGSVWALADREQAAVLARRLHPAAFVAEPGPRLVQLNAED